MVNLLQINLIIYPSIKGRFNNLITQNIGLKVPMGKVVNTLNHKKRRKGLSFGINIFDYRNLFLITKVNRFIFTLLINTCNNY